MIEQQNNVDNAIFNDFRIQRMISMLQPLGKKRRLKKVSYLFLNSDFLTKQMIKKENIDYAEKFITINTNSVEYKQMIENRRKKSKRVKEDVEKISKVFKNYEISNGISEIGNVSISISQYCLDIQNQSKPLQVINNFFNQSTSGQESDGFVIYFSGIITEGVPCMGFQISDKVYIVTIHQIIEAWTRFLKGFKHKKQLLLIIESHQAASFLDQIQASSFKVDHYNISILMSDKEKRVNCQYDHSFQCRDQNLTQFQQDQVWQINQYAGCSGFTAALCEYLLNSPPERIKQLYKYKETFYYNKYIVQPGFFGFSMKSYLDFGWYLDINYDKIYQHSSINYFGIEKSDYNLSMEKISQLQDRVVYEGFDYFGLIKDKSTETLLQDPQLIEKEKKSERQLGLLSLNSIDQDQQQVSIQRQCSDYFETYKFQATSDKNNISRFLNGCQKYSNGVKYIGQWVNNKQEGVGVAIYENGDRYEGEFADGKQCGLGYLYTNAKKNMYAGQFYNNMFYGKGLVIWQTRDSKTAFIGNFSDRQGAGYLIQLNELGEAVKKQKGIISDKQEFSKYFEDHEEILEIAEEKPMFSCVKYPSQYEIFYKENCIDNRCSFKKQLEEHQQKQQNIKKKAEEVIKLLIFQNNESNKQLPNYPTSPEVLQIANEPLVIPDVTQLPQYNELKEDLNELNPDLDKENIKADDVEFLIKHAVCKVEIKEEEIEEKKEKTQEIEKKIDSLLEDFDEIDLTLDQAPILRNTQPQATFTQINQVQNQVVDLQQNSNQQQQPQLRNQHSQENQNRLALVPLVAMKQYYGQQGIELFVSDQKVEQDVTQQYKQSMLQIGQSQNTSYMKLKIQDDDKVNFNNSVLTDEKDKFVRELKENLAQAHGCKPQDIVIFALTKGSINIEYKLKDETVCAKNENQAMEFFKSQDKYQNANLQMHSLLEHATLTPENCDPRFNCEWPNQRIAYRGYLRFHHDNKYQKQRYHLAVGWKGFGLNISKYNDTDWIGNYGNRKDYDDKKQWVVLYHGTTIHSLEGITKNGLKVGSHHKYAGATCRITGKIIDKSNKCVYLTDNADIAGNYSTPFEIGGKAYRMVFQCRVNPEKIKSPEKKPEYFIVEENDKPQLNIRPYRILLKKLSNEEFDKFKQQKEEIQQNYDDKNEAEQKLKDKIQEEEEVRDGVIQRECASESDESENNQNKDKSE
ncbi:hypothetical protein ABPG72_013840 [Tetrahymena utriculariae]